MDKQTGTIVFGAVATIIALVVMAKLKLVEAE